MLTRPGGASSPRSIQPERRAIWGLTLPELLLVIAILALLIAFLHPMNRSARPAAYRAQRSNNLKQILQAISPYEQVQGVLPPASTVDWQGRPLHSWPTLILPYLEQGQLYRSIDLSRLWDDPANSAVLQAMPQVYRCPASSDSLDGTIYLAVSGSSSAFEKGRGRHLSELTDGLGSTLAVIELPETLGVPWRAPSEVGPSLLLRILPDSTLPHAGRFQVTFVAGQFVFMKASVSAQTRLSLKSISGQEKVSVSEY